MKFCINILFILIWASVDGHHSHETYNIPAPLIEPFKNNGLRVSIPYENGVRMFAFHGSKNQQPIPAESSPTDKSTSEPVNGRLVVYDKDVTLEIGDVIHYWLFVQYNNLGFRKDNQRFVVRRLLNETLKPNFMHPTSELESHHQNPFQHPHEHAHQFHHPHPHQHPQEFMPFLPPPSQSQGNNNYAAQLEAMSAQLNETSSQLAILIDKTEPLLMEVKLLKEVLAELVRDSNNSTLLLLKNNVTRISGNPLELVRMLVTDKLHLDDFYSNILNARQIDSGILFEVSTIFNKKLILARARQYLKTSKNKIEDYRERPIMNRSANVEEDSGVPRIGPESINIRMSGI